MKTSKEDVLIIFFAIADFFLVRGFFCRSRIFSRTRIFFRGLCMFYYVGLRKLKSRTHYTNIRNFNKHEGLLNKMVA